MTKPQKIINASMLLFLSLALLVNNRDLYRVFYFAGVMLPVIYLLVRQPIPSWLRDPLFLACTGIITWLSINSIFVSEADWSAKLDQIRWGVEVWLFIAGLMFTVPIWLARPQFYGMWFAILVLLTVLIALLPYLRTGDYSTRLIAHGFLSHPIQGASVLLVYWGVSFFLLCFGRRISRLEAVLLVSAGIATLLFAILSQSRGPILSSALMLPASFMAYRWYRDGFAWRQTLMTSGGCLALAGLIWALSPEALTSWVHTNLAARGLSHRPEIWASTLEHWDSFILWGVGNATTFVNTAPGMALFTSQDIAFDHSHNIFLQIWLIGGSIGLFLFLYIIGSITLKTLHISFMKCYGLSAFGLLLIMVLSNITDTARPLASPTADWILLWLPIIIIIAATGNTATRALSLKLNKNTVQGALCDKVDYRA